MKRSKAVIWTFMLPTVISLLLVFVYPVCRTIVMSFYNMDSITAGVSSWQFVGLENYLSAFQSKAFQASLWNIFRIWLVGGVATLGIALLFAFILTSGIRGKKFYRAAIYMPNVISAVALATMWIQFVFNRDFGLLNAIIGAFGGDPIKWLGGDMKFWSMLIAYVFGSVGYYMLIFISGIEQIPGDLYEAATIDGAGKTQQFKSITLPLLKGIIKTNITFWTIGTTGFFLWSKMFSPVKTEISTIAPATYLYDLVFGNLGPNTPRNPGGGAAVGVMMTLAIVVVYVVCEKLFKDDNLEL